MKLKFVVFFIAIGLVTTGCVNREKVLTTTKPVYESLARCFAEQPTGLKLNSEPQCGYVTVPATRDATNGATLKLGVMRLKSKQATV